MITLVNIFACAKMLAFIHVDVGLDDAAIAILPFLTARACAPGTKTGSMFTLHRFWRRSI